MLVLKVLLHISALIKFCFYKIIYGKKISIGRKTTCRKNISIMIDKDAKLIIGNNCFFNNGCSINVMKGIKIGNNCIFGEGVCLYDHNHRFAGKMPIKDQGFTMEEIVIGEDCWISSKVTILKGVNIGNRVVIGAGCVIDTNIPDDTIVKLDNSSIQNIIKINREP